MTGSGYRGVKKAEFTWINSVIDHVKNAIFGRYHSLSVKHFPRYVAEFCYRFNWYAELKEMLLRFMLIGARTPPIPNRLLKLAKSYG